MRKIGPDEKLYGGVFIGQRNDGKILFLVLITQNSKTLFSLLLHFNQLLYRTKYRRIAKVIINLGWIKPYIYRVIIHRFYADWNIRYWFLSHSYSCSSTVYLLWSYLVLTLTVFNMGESSTK